MLELLDLRERRERLEPRRLEPDPSVEATVRDILRRVREEGDAALLELTRRFDGADLGARGLLATPDELAAAERETAQELRAALDALVERLRDLHARQLPTGWEDERDGVRFGEVVRPLRAVGCYVPGGLAVYPSSVAMTVAGVPEIVVASPPRPDGSLHPAVLYAAARAGATRVAKVGGAQAIAALAFGTASVPAVDRIVGPGNVYVTEAKRQVYGIVGIDGLAGPTELVVVADASADPHLLACDLVAQAEHDPEATTVVITTDPGLPPRLEAALAAELARSGRRGILDASLARTRAVLVADLARAAEVVDDLAPEHLQVCLADPPGFLERVRGAGAIFLGPWSAVPFGDYGVASNHILPTAGTARFSSGLRTSDYVTVRSWVELSPEAAARLAPEVAAIARAEGLFGHARAVEVRAARVMGEEA